MRNRRPTRMLAIGFLLWGMIGCAPPPTGPTFVWADAPPERRGRVYVYRADRRASLATVSTTIDGRDIGTFRNGEYETLDIAAGSHTLKASMRGMGFFSLGWNEHTFRVGPGEIVYIHLEVRIGERDPTALPGSRDLEISGRSDQRLSENVFIGERSRELATPDLEVSTRLARQH